MTAPSTQWTEEFAGTALDLTNYKITFRDEFDSLSISRWSGETNWFSGIHADFGHSTFARFDTYLEPFSIADGILHISMEYKDGQWESGQLQTVNSSTEGFKQSYGYFEMRGRFPEESGAWPAFWLLSEEDRYDKSNVRVEIDTVEAYSDSPYGYHGHIHYTPNATTTSFDTKISGGVYERMYSLFDDKFHTYGTMITPEWIINYVDGREIGRVAANDYTGSPFYMVVDLAMFKEPEDTSIVYDMEVDYIRAYALPPELLNKPTVGDDPGDAPTQPDVPVVPAGAGDIVGTAGADKLVGGTGDDTFWVNHAGDVVAERGRSGYDAIISSVDYTLPANVEMLKLSGNAAKVATGNASGNVIIGNARDNLLLGLGGDDKLYGLDGADRLDGGIGADLMVGGRGNDTYVVDNYGDQVIEIAGEGRDTVFASVNFAIGDQSIEAVSLTGYANLRATGGTGDDTLTGNVGNNILDGGRGKDVMAGGKGDDTYVVENAGDKVIEREGEGYDTLYTPFKVALAGTHIERAYLTGWGDFTLDGSEADNALYGNAGNNVLNGRGGADLMAGGKGDDIYWLDNVGDRVFEQSGEGNDVVNTSVSFDARGQSIERINLRGYDAINATGSAEGSMIVGNDADNVISGGVGDDWLSGRYGTDTMSGGAGADTFEFDTYLGFHEVDRILDFEHGVDKIALTTRVFKALGDQGSLNPDFFEVGTRPSSVDSHIIYDSNTGTVYYDADGSASPVWLPICTVTPGTQLTSSDFIVI